MKAWKQFLTGRRSIRDSILVTLVILTAAILLAVALTFHLFIRAYVWNRVSSQLDAIVNSVSGVRVTDSRRPDGTRDMVSSDGTRDTLPSETIRDMLPAESMRGASPPDGPTRRKRKFDGGQDRITGVLGNVVALDANGALLSYDSEEETAEELSAYFSSGHELNERIRRKAISLDSGHYIISAVCDPSRNDAFLVCYVDVTAIEAFTGQANLVLLVIICAALGLSVFLSRRISRSFAEPAQSLSAFAEEIGRGDFQRREFHFRETEFHSLAESMNRMADELREANRKQETFFQNVSHELRTPLTSIRGNAEGIVYGIMDPQVSGKIILSEADRLGGFVEDILYLSRLGRAAPDGKAAPLDLRDLLSLCVSEQRAEADKRGISFAFDFDETPVLFAIPERDARQLFGNLLSNAIRYAASRVRLDCHADASGVTVRVSDDGPGVSPEDAPRIFERFYKGAGGKHGIGLSIAKATADAYGGTIDVKRDGGAVFEVRFPVETETQ